MLNSAPLLYFYLQSLEEETSFKKLLNAEERRNRDRRIPRIALRRYKDSAFHYLYDSGNDQALLNVTGYNHQKFSELLHLFGRKFDTWTFDEDAKILRPKKRNLLVAQGRPRDLDAVGGLGLVLMWFRTRGALTRNVALHFGQTSTPLYKWLKFARKILLSVLINHPEAAVVTPNDEEIIFYISCIGAKYKYCPNVWAAMDGMKLLVEKSSNDRIQNHFYNSWKSSTYVNSLFLFAPDGRIRDTVYNCPGTFHDSTMASYGLYETMIRVYERTGAKVVVDSAFKLDASNCLVKSGQTAPVDGDQFLLWKDATSIRQLSEWGMRMIQAQFPRLYDKIQLEDEGDRRVILRLMIAL